MYSFDFLTPTPSVLSIHVCVWWIDKLINWQCLNARWKKSSYPDHSCQIPSAGNVRVACGGGAYIACNVYIMYIHFYSFLLFPLSSRNFRFCWDIYFVTFFGFYPFNWIVWSYDLYSTDLCGLLKAHLWSIQPFFWI